jgi:hypothetical protein
MRRFLLPVMLVAVAACTDTLPVANVGGAPAGPSRNILPQPAGWQGYWHNDTSLWVYDRRPEFGINAAVHSPLMMTRISSIHARLVRFPFKWEHEDAAPGTFVAAIGVLAPSREFMLQLDEPVASVVHPANAAQRDQSYQLLAARVVDLMEKYPTVRFYQLGNETDSNCAAGRVYNGTTTTDSGTVNSTYTQPNRYAQGWNYAQMLKVVYPAMKAKARAQNRGVWVVTTALTGEENYGPEQSVGQGCVPAGTEETWRFLHGMYANGARGYFDILAINTYGATASSPHSFQQTASAVNNLLNTTLNDPMRPLWITEMGSSSQSSQHLINDGNPANDAAQIDEIQRQWYEDALSIQRSAPYIQKVFGYALITKVGGAQANTGVAGTDSLNSSLGLLRSDSTGRPAFDFLTTQSYLAAVLPRDTVIGSYSVPVNGRVPVNAPFAYAPNNVITINSIGVETAAPTVIPLMIPIVYQAHVATIGWQAEVFNDRLAGTTGQGLNVEAFRIRGAGLPAGTQFCASVDGQGIGSGSPQCGTSVEVGTVGQSTPLKQLAFTVNDPTATWKVCYHVHVGNVGWMQEVCDGTPTGSTVPGQNIQAVVVRMYRR